MELSAAECQVLLLALQHKYGWGYSEAVEKVGEEEIKVSSLQAKLSVMVEAKRRSNG